MSGDYKNAKKLLPQELYEEVCKYGEGHWWFPPLSAEQHKTVKERVLDLNLQGFSSKQIAEEVGRSDRRVQQIIAQDAQDRFQQREQMKVTGV